jgi:hypothetical protein
MIDAPALRPLVMPAPGSAQRAARGQAPAGIHDFLCCDKGKSWMPTSVGMTMGGAVEPPTSLPHDLAQVMWQPLA